MICLFKTRISLIPTILKTTALLLFVITRIVILLLVPGSAKASTATLLDIKLAFINNFSKYVAWPASSFENDSSPFRVCVMADNATSEAFQAYTKKIVNSHPIITMRINSSSDADTCHLIYIGESVDSASAKKILKSVEKVPVLTIGDSPDFIQQGGIIRFVPSAKKLSFEVNTTAAKRSSLAFSSKVLSLAKIVRYPQ